MNFCDTERCHGSKVKRFVYKQDVKIEIHSAGIPTLNCGKLYDSARMIRSYDNVEFTEVFIN